MLRQVAVTLAVEAGRLTNDSDVEVVVSRCGHGGAWMVVVHAGSRTLGSAMGATRPSSGQLHYRDDQSVMWSYKDINIYLSLIIIIIPGRLRYCACDPSCTRFNSPQMRENDWTRFPGRHHVMCAGVLLLLLTSQKHASHYSCRYLARSLCPRAH